MPPAPSPGSGPKSAPPPAAVELRLATKDDAAQLLSWRNDPATRAASLTDHPISPVDHYTWLEKTLRMETRTLWIAESGRQAVGTVRLDTANDRQELSWTVAPDARGKGFGKAMVSAALDRTEGPIRARIRPENAPSRAIARACGFTRVYLEGGVETWLFRLG
ncbi:MAG: GNAT family N-acetyltransferase [Pseudomonadota bacterium]